MAKTTKQTKQPEKKVVDERKQILEDATDDFKALYKQLCTQMQTENRSMIENRYAVGRMLKDMSQAEHIYGRNSLKRMEQLMNIHACTLSHALQFYECYAEKEFKELCKLKNKNGDPLTWSHITYLVTAADKETRQTLQQLILDNNWTAAQLLAYMQEKSMRKAATSDNAGRPFSRPSSLPGLINQQMDMIQGLLDRKNKVWDGTEKVGDQTFFDVLTELSPSKVDIKRLHTLEDLYLRASIDFDSMASKISKERQKIANLQQSKQLDIELPPKPVSASLGAVDDLFGDAAELVDQEPEEEDDEESGHVLTKVRRK